MTIALGWDTDMLDDLPTLDDDIWKDRCKFSPAYVRAIFREWPFRHIPYKPERPGERGIQVKKPRILTTKEMRRVEDVAPIETQFKRLAVEDPIAYDAIVGLYLDWTGKITLDEQAERVGQWQGVTGRTVWNRAERGISKISKRLGWDKRVCRWIERSG